MTDTSTTTTRTAAVSGAGTGIGQATAVRLATAGWNVAVGGRRVDRLAETVALVEAAGGTCFAHALDVTDADSVDAFFAASEAHLGPVSAVVNNAATARYGPLDEFTPEEICAEVATKLTGSLYMARRVILGLKRARVGGDIVFISSLAGVAEFPHHLAYGAANAGVEHAVRTLRLELEGTGIRVGVLRCGETAGTDFATRELASGRSGAASLLFFRHGRLRHTGLLTPDDVATAIVAMISLPPTVQYDVLAVSPTAPTGDLPTTFEAWAMEMMKYAPSH